MLLTRLIHQCNNREIIKHFSTPDFIFTCSIKCSNKIGFVQMLCVYLESTCSTVTGQNGTWFSLGSLFKG